MAVYLFVACDGREIRIRDSSLSLEQARLRAGMRARGNVYTPGEIRSEWEKFFLDDVDVTEVLGEPKFRIPTDVFTTYPIRGYSLVYERRGYTPPGETRSDPKFEQVLCRVIVRIPENGRVRCPEELFRQVLGKKGEKLRELSQKQRIDINLVRVASAMASAAE